ncbi:MAG TPA: hypothetical protein VEA81_18005 [Burkholderiaceae bacterium]|nr:hypothetical protein [Burkholderiaceae bacterium]
MSDKPSYLGLLNAVSLAETAAHEYLECWIATTTRDDVRGILQTVSAREGEHGLAFAKRINELGYTLKKKDEPDPKAEKAMALAGRTDLSDLEKFERLGLGRLDTSGDDEPDVFARFFDDKTIDIQTGALLGRYICEERDSGRLLRACYEQLKAEANGDVASAASDRLVALEAKVDQLCAAVEHLVATTNGTNGAKSKKKVSA